MVFKKIFNRVKNTITGKNIRFNSSIREHNKKLITLSSGIAGGGVSILANSSQAQANKKKSIVYNNGIRLYPQFDMIWYGSVKKSKYKKILKENDKVFLKKLQKIKDKTKAEKDYLKNIYRIGCMNVSLFNKCRELQVFLANRDIYVYMNDEPKKDICQTPLETLRRGKGDCEDFAVLKYISLLVLGFKKEDLYVVEGYVSMLKQGSHSIPIIKNENNSIVLEIYENFMPGSELQTTKNHHYYGNFTPKYAYNFANGKIFRFTYNKKTV